MIKKFTLPSYPLRKEKAVSNIIGIILILALVVILAAITLAMLSGNISGVEKTAYVAPEVGFVNISPSIEGITVMHKGGDVMYYEGLKHDAEYEVRFVVNTSEELSIVKTNQSLMSDDTTWSPGDTIIIFRTADGYFLTNDPSKITGAIPIPPGLVIIRIIDNTNGSVA